jgi:hypothetical protein
MARIISNHSLSAVAVEDQTRKNYSFSVRGIFKNPREMIVNIFR